MGMFNDDDEEEQQPAPVAAPVQPSVKDYIMQKYKLAADDAGVRDAQDAAKRTGLISGLGRAAEGFARARSQSMGGQGVDHGLWDGMNQQAQQRIGQAQQSRQNAMQGVLGEHQLDNQLTDEDPNSDKAKTFKATVAKMYPSLGGVLDGMSYGEMQKNVPGLINSFESNNTKRDLATTKADTEKQIAELKASMKPDGPKDHWAMAPYPDADGNAVMFNTATGEQKTTGLKGQKIGTNKEAPAGKVYSEVMQKAITPRGNKSVQNASEALRQINSARGMISDHLDPNATPEQQIAQLDQMDPQDVTLLTAEIGKVASGGVGNEHTMKSIEAKSFKSEFDRFMQKVDGNPRGADLGAFIQHNRKYLDTLGNVNQRVIDNYIRDVYDGNEDRLSEDEQTKFKKKFPGSFADQQAKKGTDGGVAAQPKGDGSTAQAATGGKTLVKKQYNKSLNKTRKTYSDGTVEVLDGQQ